LVGALRKRGGVSLSYLVSESGLARQTAHSHLKHLVEAGLVSGEIKGLG
jgi:DNA-binding IclR family transcriptional regulator